MSESAPESPRPSMPVTSGDVPSFICVAYVSQQSGRCHGRVANLRLPENQWIESEGGTEREVLASLVKRFKQVLAEAHAGGGDIDWIDPPVEKNADEQKRFLPVHL